MLSLWGLAAEEDGCFFPAFLRYGLQAVQCLFEGYVLDFGALHGDHLAPLLLCDHIDCAHAEAGCEHAVVAGGCATALDVAQDGVTGFDAGQLLDFVGDVLTDTTEAGTTVLLPCLP